MNTYFDHSGKCI